MGPYLPLLYPSAVRAPLRVALIQGGLTLRPLYPLRRTSASVRFTTSMRKGALGQSLSNLIGVTGTEWPLPTTTVGPTAAPSARLGTDNIRAWGCSAVACVHPQFASVWSAQRDVPGETSRVEWGPSIPL